MITYLWLVLARTAEASSSRLINQVHVKKPQDTPGTRQQKRLKLQPRNIDESAEFFPQSTTTMNKIKSFLVFICTANLHMLTNCLNTAKETLSSLNGSYIDFCDEPQDTVGNDFTPVILNCSIGVFSAHTNTFKNITLPANITWFKNDVAINQHDLTIERFYSNGGFKIYPNDHRTSGSAYSATYQCKANYQNSVLISRKAKIETAILSQPSSPTRRIVSACVGSTVYFNCSIDKANPAPVISWFKNNRLVGNNEKFISSSRNENMRRSMNSVLPSGIMEIIEIKSKDAGKYTCYAQNIAGRKKGVLYTLSVRNDCSTKEFEPRFLAKPRSQQGVIGDSVVFECIVSGVSRGFFRWFKNLTQMDFSSNEHLDNFQPGNSTLRQLRMFGYDGYVGKYRLVGQNSLMIMNLTTLDSGEYFCSPNTEDDLLVASASLSVLALPRFVEQPTHLHQAYLGCQISFVCNVTGWPLPTVTWYKNGELLSESKHVLFGNKSLSIRVMNGDDAGAYQCFATNRVGSVQTSFQLRIIREDSDDPADLDDVLSGDGMLRLSDSSPSSASLTWSLFGLLHPTKYRIEWEDSTYNRSGVISTEAQPRSVTLDALKAGSTVRVSATPLTPVCEGPRSKTIDFTTPQQHAVSTDMIRNLAVEAISSTSLWVTWEEPLNRADDEDIKYKIAMWETNAEPSPLKEVLTSDTSQEYQGLKKYTMYSVKVAVVDDGGNEGSYSSPVALRTLEDIPDEAPTNVSVAIVGIDSVTIRWSTPPPSIVNGAIRGYNIKYKDLDKRKNSQLNLDGDITEYELKGLRSSAEYSVRIQVRNGVGSSVWTKRIYFETGVDPKLETKAPGKPALLDTKIGSSEMMVMWAPPQDDVTVREYRIGWGESGPYEHGDTTEASQRYYRITGLEPNTEYFISVRAVNRAGQGEEYHIDVRTKTTDDEIDELYPPLNVHVTVLTATTLNVTWHDTAMEEEVRYVIRYKTNVPEEPRVRFLNSSDISCIIHGLRPYTVYDISVKIVVGDRQSTWSMTETARTKESKPGTPPTDLTLMPIEGEKGSVQLNWQPPVEPNGELNGYLVFYSDSATSEIDDWVIEPVLGDKLSTKVECLKEGTHYYFKALARNKQGVGPYSDLVEYRTPSTSLEVADTSTPLKLSKPMWYLIIGGVVLLFIIIVIVIIIMVYRRKRAKNDWNFTRGKSVSGVGRRSINGVRSPSSTSWPLNSNPARPSLRHLPPQSTQFELHSLHSPTSRFTQDEFPNFHPAPPEVVPLNDPPYRYDYQRVPVSSPLHDPLRSSVFPKHPFAFQGEQYNHESNRIALHRDISCEKEQRYQDYHAPQRGASVPTPTQIDHTGDSAYGSDHHQGHLADNTHLDQGDVSLQRSQNQYSQSNRCSDHQRSSSLSISACSSGTIGSDSESFAYLDGNDPALTNVQQFLDDMRNGNTVV